MYRGCRGLVFLSFLFVGFFLPAVSFAAPLPIDNSPQFRETVQGPDGSLHTVWVDQDGLKSSIVYQAKDATGRTFAGPMVISEAAARIRRPQLAIDGRRSVHFLWQERIANQETAIRYTTVTLTPTGIAPIRSQPVTINQDQTATHPSLAVDRAGWAYAAWEREGLDVVLAAIEPSGRIVQIRHISREATKTDHAFPTVAVDRRGDVHVVWSAQSGDKTQLVYKAFRGHGGQVLEKEKIVYTTSDSAAQAKVVTFDTQGNIKVAWIHQSRQHGRVAKMDRGRGYLVLRHGRSGSGGSVVAAVVDQSLTVVPSPVWNVAGEAVMTPKPRLDASAVGTVSFLLDANPTGKPSSSMGDDTISKLLMERLLRYATWSAAPPSVQETETTRLLLPKSSLSSANFRLIKVNLSSLFLSDSEQKFAFQPVPLTQGGDQIG